MLNPKSREMSSQGCNPTREVRGSRESSAAFTRRQKLRVTHLHPRTEVHQERDAELARSSTCCGEVQVY